jgi:hypothetical protein
LDNAELAHKYHNEPNRPLVLSMSIPFFDHPTLNSPYDRPSRHWELDETGQPTQKIEESRRRAQFITPIPKPKKRKSSPKQEGFVFDDGKMCIKVSGVDVFKPQTDEVVSHGADGIACWFIDTDYNEESFFVRHAYFLGANDPYSALKTTLKAEIDQEAWATLNSDTSRPFEKPKSGRIAVKVINHLGDGVMKVFRVV